MGLPEEKLWVTGEQQALFPSFLQVAVSSSGTSTFITMSDFCDNELSCQQQ
jgi:hypothetical protein